MGWLKKLMNPGEFPWQEHFANTVVSIAHITAFVCQHDPDRTEAILNAKTSVEFARAINVPSDQLVQDTMEFLRARYGV